MSKGAKAGTKMFMHFEKLQFLCWNILATSCMSTADIHQW